MRRPLVRAPLSYRTMSVSHDLGVYRYTGPTGCVAPYTCVKSNDYVSCITWSSHHQLIACSPPVQPVPVINEMMSSGFGEVCARASSCGLPPCPFISPTFRRHLCLITVLACALGSRRNPRCLRAHKPRIENPLVLPVHEVATTTYRRGGSCSVTTALLSSATRSKRAHC